MNILSPLYRNALLFGPRETKLADRSAFLISRCFLLALAASLTLGTAFLVPVPAHAQAAQKAKALNLAPLLGKDFTAYEQVLGKPAFVEMKDNFADEKNEPSEIRYYKCPGFVRLVLTRGSNGVYSKGRTVVNGIRQWESKPTKLLSYVSRIEVQFGKKSSAKWQNAFQSLGLLPAKAKVGFESSDGRSFALQYDGLIAFWEPSRQKEIGGHSLTIDIDSENKR